MPTKLQFHKHMFPWNVDVNNSGPVHLRQNEEQGIPPSEIINTPVEVLVYIADVFIISGLMIQTLSRELFSVADENGGKLKNRVVFFCDELGTMPAFDILPLLSAGRSRKLTLVPIIQSLAQLEKNYGKCWPGIRTIAKELGLSQSTVKRALDELYKAELVSKEHRWRENGSLSSNLYRLL